MSYMNDGGHGGRDSGAVSNGNIEKVYTLEASQYVDKRLKYHGIRSSQTRTTDVTLDESPRVNKVKNSGMKRCLSHHFNAGGGNGFECIHSIHSNGSFEKILLDEFKKAGYPTRNTPIYTRKGSGGSDYYFMHRRTGSVSTTIIEYDFVDGPNAEKLKSKAYREGMYECVVRAVCRQDGVRYVPIKKEEVKVTQPKQVDNTPDAWAKESWEKANKKIGKDGQPILDGKRPKESITRQELAKVLDRLGVLD